jgi:hypothetical protein
MIKVLKCSVTIEAEQLQSLRSHQAIAGGFDNFSPLKIELTQRAGSEIATDAAALTGSLQEPSHVGQWHLA